MEKSVGPLAQEELDLLVDLLLAADAKERVMAEQGRQQAEQAARLEPADARAGEALFHGRRAFANGGLSCAACHEAGGAGGNLAVGLQDGFARLGQASLLSVCETPSFPAMRVVYGARPIQKQEAVHVVKYLESLKGTSAPVARSPLGWGGLLGAAVVLAGIGYGLRGTPAAGTRARLVRSATTGAQRGEVKR